MKRDWYVSKKDKSSFGCGVALKHRKTKEFALFGKYAHIWESGEGKIKVCVKRPILARFLKERGFDGPVPQDRDESVLEGLRGALNPTFLKTLGIPITRSGKNYIERWGG